jgi:hypothetical protein
MAMKINLSGLGGISNLLLKHGEKLGIVIVGICALMMVYKSLTREKLPPDKQASRLGEQITQARQSIEGFNWDRMKAEFPGDIRQAKPLEQKGGDVRRDDYLSETWQLPWDRSPVPPTVYRTDPVLLSVQSVEVRGGSGLLAYVDPEVRRNKMLEERTKESKRAAEQQKLSQQQQEDQGRGGRDRGGAESDLGADFDPAHPKRRPVVGTVRSAGVPLQDYEKVNTAHWAIVVAKIPIKEQIKLYRDAFENARDYQPNADLPRYLGYFVERIEIQPGDEDKDLDWNKAEKVNVYSGEKDFTGRNKAPLGGVVSPDTIFGKADPTSRDTVGKPGAVTNWVAQMQEVVDPRFLEGGALAFPLPPLVGREWGREVTHSEIPLAIDAMGEEDAATPEAVKPDAAKDSEPGDLFSGAGAMPSGGMLERDRSGFGAGRGGLGGGGIRIEGGAAMGMRGGYGGDRGEPGHSAMAAGLGDGGEPQKPHWLLRFFDFSVHPGKKYRYRVRMALLDPNQNFGNHVVSLDSLDKDVLARVKKEKLARKPRPGAPPPTPYRLTEWSKPSAAVSIPLAGSVRVASAKAPSDRFNDEPTTTLLVESFGNDDKNNAIQVAKEKSFKRGGVANMSEDAEMLAAGGRAIDPVKDFQFQTDITVVDVHGGERLTRDELRPGRVLLMGPGGQLFVQDELGDADAVATHRQTFAKEPANGAGGGSNDGYRGQSGFDAGGSR